MKTPQLTEWFQDRVSRCRPNPDSSAGSCAATTSARRMHEQATIRRGLRDSREDRHV